MLPSASGFSSSFSLLPTGILAGGEISLPNILLPKLEVEGGANEKGEGVVELLKENRLVLGDVEKEKGFGAGDGFAKKSN